MLGSVDDGLERNGMRCMLEPCFAVLVRCTAVAPTGYLNKQQPGGQLFNVAGVLGRACVWRVLATRQGSGEETGGRRECAYQA